MPVTFIQVKYIHAFLLLLAIILIQVLLRNIFQLYSSVKYIVITSTRLLIFLFTSLTAALYTHKKAHNTQDYENKTLHNLDFPRSFVKEEKPPLVT
jgi:hypothetical protein